MCRLSLPVRLYRPLIRQYENRSLKGIAHNRERTPSLRCRASQCATFWKCHFHCRFKLEIPMLREQQTMILTLDTFEYEYQLEFKFAIQKLNPTKLMRYAHKKTVLYLANFSSAIFFSSITIAFHLFYSVNDNSSLNNYMNMCCNRIDRRCHRFYVRKCRKFAQITLFQTKTFMKYVNCRSNQT